MNGNCTYKATTSPLLRALYLILTPRPKRRHGKFRPTLMSLVSSNPEPFAKSTIASAITTYDNKPANAQNALDTLVKLKGIGPATASLLLNVHDPRGVIFFSDEAYYWLCCGGKKGVVKYTAKEYRELRERAADLGKRLGVGMVDVEKVAYVVMKRDGLGDDGKKVEVVKMKLNDKVDKKEGKPVRKTTKDVKPKKETAAKKEAVPKRKTDKDVEETGLRRSKRQRA